MMRVGHHYMPSMTVFRFDTPYGPIELLGAAQYLLTASPPLRLERIAYVRREMPIEELVDFACGIVRSDN